MLEIRAILDAERRLTSAHLADFPEATRGIADLPVAPDVDAVEREIRRDAMRDIGWFARSARRAARESARRTAVVEVNELVRRGLDEAQGLQRAMDEHWAALVAHDAETVISAVEDAFADNGWASVCVDAGVGSARPYLTCAVLSPVADTMPERAVGTTPAGNPTARKRTKTDRNHLYAAAVGSTVLATVKEALATSPATQEVRIVVVRPGPNGTNPQQWHAIYLARFDRARIAPMTWRTLDPAVELLTATDATFKQKGSAQELVGLDTSGDPDLAFLIAEIRTGFTG